jgi:hypothetical protein
MTRTWYRITQLSAAPAVRPRRRWVPATAAAAVLLLAAATVTLLRVGPGTLWPVASTPDAVSALGTLADAAAAGPAAPELKPGQPIYVEHDGWAANFKPGDRGDFERQLRHIWLNPQGMLAVKITDGTRDLGGIDAEPKRPQPAPSLYHPTPQWLAELPTDPQKLLSLLRKETGRWDTWTVDHQLWDALAQLYSDAEILLTPQTRAALLRAAAGMTGLSVRQATVDGVDLVAIRHTDGNSGDEILFDPATGRSVGRASVFLGAGAFINHPADGPVFDPHVGYQSVWRQSIVDSTAGA